MKRKHIWHCNHCGCPCEIYKKGKGHRVIICPRHGIIASNPGMLGSAIELASSFIPIPGAAMAGKVASKLLGGSKAASESPTQIARSAGYPIKVREPVLVDID